MIGKSYQVDLLSGLLQQAEMRHQVISQNIANVNTPGYRAVDISFEQTLEQLENRDLDNPIEGTIVETSGLSMRQDGNNVDIDRELGKLTKNAMQFEMYSQLLTTKMGIMRSAITGQ